MISLTFGEQVKIILSRKGMTIKELAEQIEERTGKKMSRQNLTQRLGRDNFQEQDMRMIADILGCAFQLSILASAEAERASAISEEMPTDRELTKLAVKKEQKQAKAEAKLELERDITVGEFVEMMAAPVTVPVEAVTEVPEQEMLETKVETEEPEQIEDESSKQPERALEADAVEEAIEAEEMEAEDGQTESVEAEQITGEAEASEESQPAETALPEEAEELTETAVEVEPEHQDIPEEPVFHIEVTEKIMEAGPEAESEAEEHPVIHEKKSFFKKKEKKRENSKYFEPIKKRDDEEEDQVVGDVNPYTGHEYLTNSVRMHPKRIGYVQVYDRKEHKWTDMTEWAFLGFEERKKVMLGKDYEPPIYLD